jgi:N-acetylglucosaminyl-diphospho-decaprenol L-rhamnosyltransferase
VSAAAGDVHLSVVVLSWNTREILRACLESLARDVSPRAREVIVVDNASADGSADMVARDFPAVRLLRNPENRLYSEANNQGARLATGEWLCLLNSDTEVRPGALDRLADFLAANADYGAVAPRLVNPDGSVQRACARLPGLLAPLLESTTLGRVPPLSLGPWWLSMGDFDHVHSRDVPQPPGACFMMRRVEYLQDGGLDPVLSLFFNDVDLCRRLAARGRKVRYLAEAEVMHHRGFSTRAFKATNSNLTWMRNRAAYYRKHHGALGERWLAAVLWLWGFECGMRIRLGPREAAAKRQALAELRAFLQRASAP